MHARAMNDESAPAPIAPNLPASFTVSARQMDSDALFDGTREVRIDHHGQEYRLRQTRNGKLILTK